MRNITFIFVLLFLTSCDYSRDRPEDNRSSDATTSEVQELSKEELAAVNLTYFDTINVHDTDMVIIPIGAWKTKARGSKGITSAYVSKNGYSYEDYKYFNLLFYDLEKDSSYLFFDQERAMIGSVLPNVNDSGASASRFIFYNIRDKDYNLDGELNYEDSNHLFISDKKGQNLVQLTPNNSRLQNWTIIKKSNIIIAKVLMDSNNDKEFDKSKGDDERLIKIDLDNVKKGRPFLSPKTEEQLKEQFLDLMVKTK